MSSRLKRLIKEESLKFFVPHTRFHRSHHRMRRCRRRRRRRPDNERPIFVRANWKYDPCIYTHLSMRIASANDYFRVEDGAGIPNWILV